MKIEENIALAPLTTLEVGGAARFFVEAKSEEEIIEALKFAQSSGLPVFILGGGSNLLVSDAGFDGLVIKIAVYGVEFTKDKNSVFVTVRAGENWDDFVKICVERNLAGIECLSGIPGSVGATPVQNVGAYGQEVSETITTVRVLDRANLEIKNLTNADCGFEYRSSIFNITHKNKFIILAVTFCLQPYAAAAIRYADLQKYFAEKENPNLAETRQAVLQIRAAKSMVIRKDDENRRSAGSFFKNPIISTEKFNEIEKKARKLNLISPEEIMPKYSAGEKVKIPAAWLIERSGFHKGFARGRVGISTRHTLAIVNRGGATASEIVEFVREIQTKVYSLFGVGLQPEPVWLGFEEK